MIVIINFDEICLIFLMGEQNSQPNEPVRRTLRRSWLNWRKSSTSTATSAARDASKWQRCSTWRSARSKFGSKTGAWSSKKSRKAKSATAATAATASVAPAWVLGASTRTTNRRAPWRRRRCRRRPLRPLPPPTTTVSRRRWPRRRVVRATSRRPKWRHRLPTLRFIYCPNWTLNSISSTSNINSSNSSYSSNRRRWRTTLTMPMISRAVLCLRTAASTPPKTLATPLSMNYQPTWWLVDIDEQ